MRYWACDAQVVVRPHFLYWSVHDEPPRLPQKRADTQCNPSVHGARHDVTGNAVRRLSPSEAAPMDPQGRLLLEQSALGLRDANLRLQRDMDANTGVYVGVMHMEFIQYMNGKLVDLLLYVMPNPSSSGFLHTTWVQLKHVGFLHGVFSMSRICVRNW